MISSVAAARARPDTAQIPALHVDAAASAALLAIERGRGIYDIAEPNGYLSTDKVRRELGSDPGFRLPVG